MTDETRKYVIEKTHTLLSGPTCCPELKAVAQAWLDAACTAGESEATAKYIAELKEDVLTIDALIGFASSDTAVKILGADRAKGLLAHANELKDSGCNHCDCIACSAGADILEKIQ